MDIKPALVRLNQRLWVLETEYFRFLDTDLRNSLMKIQDELENLAGWIETRIRTEIIEIGGADEFIASISRMVKKMFLCFSCIKCFLRQTKTASSVAIINRSRRHVSKVTN